MGKSKQLSIQNRHKPAQLNRVVRLIGGAYLVYLAYGLIKEVLVSSGVRQMVQIGCTVVFAAAGIWLFIWSLRKLRPWVLKLCISTGIPRSGDLRMSFTGTVWHTAERGVS